LIFFTVASSGISAQHDLFKRTGISSPAPTRRADPTSSNPGIARQQSEVAIAIVGRCLNNKWYASPGATAIDITNRGSHASSSIPVAHRAAHRLGVDCDVRHLADAPA
jgi:hypothetical protein